MIDKDKLRKALRVESKTFKEVEKFIGCIEPLTANKTPKPFNFKGFKKAFDRYKKSKQIRENLERA